MSKSLHYLTVLFYTFICKLPLVERTMQEKFVANAKVKRNGNMDVVLLNKGESRKLIGNPVVQFNYINRDGAQITKNIDFSVHREPLIHRSRLMELL